MLEMETPTQKEDINKINDFCFDPIDLGMGIEAISNANENVLQDTSPQKECDELVESVRILITDADNETLLLEIDDLELTEVKLRGGVFTLTAVQKLCADIIYFQKAIDEGRLVRLTVRGTFS